MATERSVEIQATNPPEDTLSVLSTWSSRPLSKATERTSEVLPCVRVL